MNVLKGLFTGIILFASSISYANQANLGKYPSVYEGDDYTVTILRLGEKEDKTVLIKVDGVDNDFDGEIFRHTQKCDNLECSSFKYETKEIPGKKRWWTIQSTRTWGRYDNLILYPPGIDKKSSIVKVKRPKDFNADKFYKLYLGQKARR